MALTMDIVAPQILDNVELETFYNEDTRFTTTTATCTGGDGKRYSATARISDFELSRFRGAYKYLQTHIETGLREHLKEYTDKYITTSSGTATTANVTFDTWDSTSGTLTVPSDWNRYTSGNYNPVSWGIVDDSGNVIYASSEDIEKETPEQKKRREFAHKIKNNLFINVKSRAKPISGVKENEQVAIETLREEISETEFRKYMRYGFICVRGRSGQVYQIFKNRYAHTKVWKGGRLIEELCVRIKDNNIPDTDNVIALKTMVEADEEAFKNMANRYKKAA